jgi:hypothetical protein
MQLHDQPLAYSEEWEAAVLAQDGTHRYLIVRMGFNQRLIGLDRWDQPVYGWCFRPGPYAMAALVAWDPATQDEPILWHKRAGNPRRAPHRDHNLDYNRPRCVHGSYLHERACEIDPFCAEFC